MEEYIILKDLSGLLGLSNRFRRKPLSRGQPLYKALPQCVFCSEVLLYVVDRDCLSKWPLPTFDAIVSTVFTQRYALLFAD